VSAYSSSDTSVLNFITAQNTNRGGTAPYSPAVLNNGIAGTTTNNVIGFSSLAQSAPAISMGSGFNTVIIDGQNSMNAAASGSPDSFYFYVNPSGDVILFDNNTHASVSISGVSFIIFDGAATGTGGAYQSMYYVGNANHTEITELYTAAFGRQPDLGGVEYYANELNSGIAINQIANQFQASPEFQARYGANVSDASYVTNLYQNVLHRAPSSVELAYYQSALSNYENGVTGASSGPSWSRAQELLNFTNSPENQTNVSGFVVSTAPPSAAYDVNAAPGTETALQVLTAAEATGVVDTTLINPASLPSIKEVLYLDVNGHTQDTVRDAIISAGGAEISPSVVSAFGNSAPSLGTSNTTGTFILSSTINTFEGTGKNLIIDGASTGGSSIYSYSGTINLHGTGNEVISQINLSVNPAGLITVNGFTSGDTLLTAVYPYAPMTILRPTAGQPVIGANLKGSDYAIYVGNVGSGTAAEVATAANAAYKVTGYGADYVTFFGQTNSGDTVVYALSEPYAPYTPGNPLNSGVASSDFGSGVMLVGVSPSQITSATFAVVHLPA